MPNLSELLIYNGEVPLSIILWSIFTGVFIAAIASFIIKVKFGAFMQALLDKKASSPETAMTLADTGIKAGFFVKMGLKSHASYKNLMVAITDDGKYYANAAYTDEPPVLKTFVLIHTKKKSRVKDKATEVTEAAKAEPIAPSEDEQSAPTPKYVQPKQRVKFDIFKAKYYIPPELHDRAASLYFGKPPKFVAVIGILIALGIVVAFSENIIVALTDFMSTLKN